MEKKIEEIDYLINEDFKINLIDDCGFEINIQQLVEAIKYTNVTLKTLPFEVYKVIDFKSISGMVGAIFCNEIEQIVDGCVVNPIEKGHPDIVPIEALKFIKDEKKLKNYGKGLEIKCTVGNVKSTLGKGEPRINSLSGMTWQAHHREVDKLLSLIWDFVDNSGTENNYPIITGAFYANDLSVDDWGAISGTEGRNTKVTGMKKSGKVKLGSNWISMLDNELYLKKYKTYMGIQ